MRKVAVMMMAMALIVVSGSVLSGEEEVVSKWFDMENCQMCKPMMETEGFMQNVTWESYPIANGMVSITTVAKGYEEKYKIAHDGMMANWEKLQAGEEMVLCGMCEAFKAAMNETVKTETVQTMNGEVGLTTSDDAATVAALQKIAERNAKEMAMMMKEKTGHEGHDHE